MNRSILIVICDFIVSAMLTMIAGMSDAPAPPLGGGVPLDNRAAAMVLEEVRREQARLAASYRQLMEERFRTGDPEAKRAEMEELTKRLAEAGARAELLEKQLALTPDTTGPLSSEQLQRQLEHELNERHLLRLKQQEAEALLEELQRRNRETGEKYQDLREQFAARQAQLKEMERRVGAAEAELATARGTLAERAAEVGVLSREAANLRRLGAEDRKKREASEAELAQLRANLNAAEQRVAEEMSRNRQAQKEILAKELAVRDAQRQVETMRESYKTVVTKMSQVTAEKEQLVQEKQQISETLTQKEVVLKATQEKLADTEKQLKYDVLTCYSAATMKLQLRIREKQLLIPRSLGEDACYLPLISLAGKTCLIGDLRLLLGNQRDRDNYANLTELGYTAAPARSAEAGTPLAGPLLVPKASCALALLEAPADGRTPLKVLTPEQLKKRGVQELYLFKHGAFGKSFAPLERRCGLDLTSGAESLRIRNAAHGTGGELRAEPGDFVMTRQGEFVGVVTEVETFDAGRRQEARCSLLPDAFDWRETVPLPLVAAGADASAFDRAARPVLEQLRQRGETRLP